MQYKNYSLKYKILRIIKMNFTRDYKFHNRSKKVNKALIIN